jgi:dipeptidase E
MHTRPSIARPVVALGGGGFASRADPRRDRSALDTLILELARARAERAGRARPRLVFIGTASGDDPRLIGAFHAAFDDDAEVRHLGLFDRDIDDIDAFLADQDGIYVGGGNTASLLAVWRTHGVDRALRDAHAAGIVLAGRSAGSICWFESGTTDSWGPSLGAVTGGLGLIPGSHSPHYDGEAERRPTYHRLIAAGDLSGGYAVDDGAALVFDGSELVAVVAERDGAAAYRVELVDGDVRETPLVARRLP